jgi:hypothetical protein
VNLQFETLLTDTESFPESVIIEHIKIGIRNSRVFTDEFLKLVSKAEEPADFLQLDVIIIILLLSISPNHKKKIEALVSEKVRQKVKFLS